MPHAMVAGFEVDGSVGAAHADAEMDSNAMALKMQLGLSVVRLEVQMIACLVEARVAAVALAALVNEREASRTTDPREAERLAACLR